MSAIDSSPKFGKAVYDDNGKVRQSIKTMGGSFDANEMIENQVAIKEIPLKKIEDEDATNKQIIEELEATRIDFDPVAAAIKNLSNPTSTSDGGVNLFGIVDASLSSSSGLLAASDIATFDVKSSTATTQTFSVEVTQKASADVMVSTATLTTADTLTSPIVTGGNLSLAFNGTDTMTGTVTVLTADLATPVISTNGNLILPNKEAGGTDVTIALTDTMTLETVAKTLNQNTYQTGIVAKLENDDNTGMRLVLTSKETGLVIDPTGSDASILTDLGLESVPANLTQTMIDIPLDSTMDYATVVTTINEYATKTNVQAELVDTGVDTFKFALTAQGTGFAIDPSTSTGSILTDLGITAAATDVTNLQAKVNYKGVEVVSSTNSFELVSGVTINVLKAETNNKFDVTIGPPIDQIADHIDVMVDKMNDALANLRKRLDPENEESHMQKIDALKHLELSVSNAFGGALQQFGLSSQTQYSKIGEDSNYALIFDRDVFLAKAKEDFNAVKTAFAFNDNRVGDGINILNKPSAMPTDLSGKTFTVSVTAADADGKATAAEFVILNGATITADVTNGVISGPSGSDFEDFSFYYYGEAAGVGQTVEFSPTYGTMNKLVSIFDNLFDSDTGSVSAAEDRITGTSEIKGITQKNAEKIEKIKKDIEDFRSRMIAKYTASQARVQALESAIQLMKVQMGLASAAAA